MYENNKIESDFLKTPRSSPNDSKLKTQSKT
jgi:hypothetical protein